MDRSQKGQIRNLLVVLSSALLTAVVVAAVLLHQYGPSGRYAFSGTLLAPELVQALSFNDTNSKTGGISRFIFSDIAYQYYDYQKKQWQQISVPVEQYSTFYQFVGNQQSVSEDDERVSLFSEGMPSKLLIMSQTESSASWQELKKPFQEVQFAKSGDDFRVQLREDNIGSHWAYFHVPGILKKAHSFFAGSQ